MKGMGQACLLYVFILQLDWNWSRNVYVAQLDFHGLLGIVILSSATAGRAGLRGAGGHLASMR